MTRGTKPSLPVDPGPSLTTAITLSLDPKGKSPKSRWQQEHEAWEKELQHAMDLSREEAKGRVHVRHTREALLRE
jgi:hypothetical protein